MTYNKFDELVKKLTEAPVTDIGLHGDWEDKRLHKYDRASIKLLKRTGYLEKLKSTFAKDIGIDFNLFFVKSREASQHTEIGKVDPASLATRISDVDVKPIIDSIRPNNITIVFTNNVGDSKVLMTPWITAHRTGHVLYRASFSDRDIKREWDLLMQEYGSTLRGCYDINIDRYGRGVDKDNSAKLKKLMTSLGTFRSARENKIVRPFEFIYELFAQYLIEGGITFNETNDNMCAYELQANFESAFSQILYKSQGKLFLM